MPIMKTKRIQMQQMILLAGMSMSLPAFAACPFGIDCKPLPCSSQQQETATVNTGAGYAPRFQPVYGAPQPSASSYQANGSSNAFYAGNSYQLPPCDPALKPPEDKPVILPTPDPKEEDEEEDKNKDDQEAS
jgi:hypothetical protein